jgi:hypothetical protein
MKQVIVYPTFDAFYYSFYIRGIWIFSVNLTFFAREISSFIVRVSCFCGVEIEKIESLLMPNNRAMLTEIARASNGAMFMGK